MRWFIALILLCLPLQGADLEVDSSPENAPRVLDGDTVEVWVIHRFHLDKTTKSYVLRRFTVRFDAFDASETRRIMKDGKRVTDQEVERGIMAKAQLQAFITNQQLRLKTDYRSAAYGRIVGTLFMKNRTTGEWQNVTDMMKAAGHERKK